MWTYPNISEGFINTNMDSLEVQGLRTSAGRPHQDHPDTLSSTMCGAAGSVLEFVLELLYPRFELVHQLLQRLHCIIANWCHCERVVMART